MNRYDIRLQRLEKRLQASGARYTLWIADDETEEDALRRARVPDNADTVVFIRQFHAPLPENKRGAIRWLRL